MVRLDPVGQHQVRFAALAGVTTRVTQMLAHLLFSADSQTNHHSTDRIRLRRHNCRFHGWALFTACFALIVFLGFTPLQAADFSVETEVFTGKNAKLVEQRVTVFTSDKVIDFSRDNLTEIFVLDTALNELTIVDGGKRETSKVAANELVRFVAEQQALIAKMPAGLRSRLMPFLKVTWQNDNKTLTLAGQDFSYRAQVSLAADGKEVREATIEKEMVTAYRKFTDWIARYNAMRPQAMPPQSRLKLNGEIAKLDAVPQEIVKTTPNGTARSTHKFSALRKDDRVRVQEILQSIPEYESLELGEFLSRR